MVLYSRFCHGRFVPAGHAFGQIELRNIRPYLSHIPFGYKLQKMRPNRMIKTVNVRHISYESGLVISQSVQTGEWALLSARMPGRPPEAVGILLRDPTDG